MVDRSTATETNIKQAILAGTPYIVTKQFPWKLHEMIDSVEKRGEESIVSWLPGGRAFKVHIPDLFVEKIMKLSFNQNKYKSFQRQLNLWGFERNTKGCLAKGSYCHPLFIRGRRDLCQEMARQKIKFPSPKQNEKKHYESSGIASLSTKHIKQTPPQLVQSTPSPLLSNQFCNMSFESATRIHQPALNPVVMNTLRVLSTRRNGLPPLVPQSHASFYTRRSLVESFALQVSDAEVLRAIRGRAALETALVSLARAPWDPRRVFL
jgi:hypothetical protein